MLTWFLNPWMLLGGLAIASPILIHLLNKRRFKIVEWAAMDFLFDADKKNRRRVQLENLVLLVLRCLAMLLVALMLARPFLPTRFSRILQQTQKFERVILIDDSLSQRVIKSAQPAIENVKSSVTQLMSRLANSDQSEDWLTVLLTSEPSQPLLANEPLTANTVATLAQTIEDIETADTPANYRVALSELSRYLGGQREHVSRVVYLYSDLRETDWATTEPASSASSNSSEMSADSSSGSAAGRVNEIAESTLGFFLVDTGSSEDNNLAITGIRPDGLQVADKLIRYAVTVTNHGSQTVQDVRVLLKIDEGQPQYQTLPSLAAGGTEEVSFVHLFSSSTPSTGLVNPTEERAAPVHHYRVFAEIDRPSLDENGLRNDSLLEDSRFLFAARVMNGVSVLLVDGDPSAVSERSETHYLRSLDVLGTGLDAKVVTVSELETVSLSRYQVIFLCNVDEASPDRIASLERWVERGGALVLMPGNRVRASTFNSAFYRNGEGLSPLKLTKIAGDPTLSRWVNFEIDPQIHPALQMMVDSDATSLSNVDVFSWWKSELSGERIGKSVSVPLRLSDQDHSPAMAERMWGHGKVIGFTIPGDGDWTMWPSSPTFAPVMIDLIDYLVGAETDQSGVEIGGTISCPVDLSVYDQRVGLRDPKNEKIETVAKPVGRLLDRALDMPLNQSSHPSLGNSTPPQDPGARPGESGESADPSAETGSQLGQFFDARFDNIQQRGFYTVELMRHSGETDRTLFAANYDTRESQLKRIPEAIFDGGFFSDRVSRVSTDALAEQSVSGGNSEIWVQLLMALFGVLLVEQFLGWWWGRKR